MENALDDASTKESFNFYIGKYSLFQVGAIKRISKTLFLYSLGTNWLVCKLQYLYKQQYKLIISKVLKLSKVLKQRYAFCLILNQCSSLYRNTNNQMILILLTMLISSLCLPDFTKPPKDMKFSLSPTNLIINPLIQYPNIGKQKYDAYVSIQGWNTKKKIIEVINGCIIQQLCYKFSVASLCGFQFMDLDSDRSNEQYYQRFNLTAGRDFQIQFDWVVQWQPTKNSAGLSLVWNNFTIDKFYSQSCTLQTQTYYVTSINQINEIVFQSLGVLDSYGIVIRNIFVRELIYEPTAVSPSLLPAVPYFEFFMNKYYDYSKPSRLNKYSLNTTNFIANPLIDKPVIQPLTSKVFPKSVNGWSTKVQNIQYIDGSEVRYCNGQNFSGWQFIDTDSINSNQKYYQSINLEKGKEFELRFDWVPESPYDSQSTGFSVAWNGVTIATFYDNGCAMRTSTFYLKSDSETNQIVFEGMGAADSQGILIRNVYLREVIYQQIIEKNNSTTLNMTFFTMFEQLSSSFGIFGSLLAVKGNLRFILGYIVEFSHFVPYNYHRIKHTPMADSILVGMKIYDDQRGSLLDRHVYPYFNTTPQSILRDFNQQSSLYIKINDIYPFYAYRPNGFLLQITDGFFLSFLVTLFFFSLGATLFWLMSKHRFSLIFRQFSVLGCFWLVCLDGRIEILTFNFLSNTLLLSSSSFLHKLKNAAIVYCYFFVFLLAVASVFIFRSFYNRLKLLKYINQNCRRRSLSSTFYTFLSFGLYNIVLGALHRLLISFPLLQLFSLLVFETAYASLMIALIFHKFFKNNFLAVTICLMNLSRLSFFATFLVFHYWSGQVEAINTVQKYVFCAFVVLWGLSSLIYFFDKVRLVYTSVRHSCHKNRVAPTSQRKQGLTLKRASNIERKISNEITSLKQLMKSSKESASKTINLLHRETRHEKKVNFKKRQK